MKKSTHIQVQREKAVTVKEAACKLIGCTEMEYCEYQYSVGKQYLQSLMPNYPTIIDELVCHKLFWAWWRNCWMLRDELFVIEAPPLHNLARWQLYSELHDYKELIREIYPPMELIIEN